jgi:hypothetical protein
MNRLPSIAFAFFLAFASSPAFAVCGTNICSAELPNDSDQFRAVGRVSVRLVGQSSWTAAYSKDLDDANPFDGSCECRDSQESDMEAALRDKLSELQLSYDHYLVECYIAPPQGGDRSWTQQGRFNIGDTTRTYNEWGRFFCGNNPFRFKFASDLIESRFEIASALLNDADLDGLGDGDDNCDNSQSPNFGWDVSKRGTLLLAPDSGSDRGCFAPKEAPASNGIKGSSIQKQCTATVTGRSLKSVGRSEIFKMSVTAPALQIANGEELKAAAETILKLRYEQQAEVYALCSNGEKKGPFATNPYGREYAEWQAAGACGGALEVVEFELVPLVSDGTVTVACLVENDSDGDGVGNEMDMCPMTASGSSVFPDTYSDESQRGCVISCGPGKEYLGERCELSCPAGSLRDGSSPQCKCDDGTVFDPNAGNICENKDEDKDGVLWPADQCPRSPFPSIVNAQGCELDTDADSVPDRIDHCPLTPANTTVDLQGCGLDSDGDGIEDAIEYADATVDCRDSNIRGSDGQIIPSLSKSIIRSRLAYSGKYLGCENSKIDLDLDGVANAADLCPATAKTEAASLSCSANSKICGCSFSDLDLDGDGIKNADDICPSSVGTVAAKGCAAEDINAAPSSSLCPVQSFEALTEEFYKDIVSKGQAANCQSPLDVIDTKGRSYGSVCQGTEGYYTLQLEKNLSAVVSNSSELSARSACYIRGNSSASLGAQYISPLYQAHHVKIWKNREQLQILAGSQQYACQALLNDYNVHVSAYHGLSRSPRETLRGHDIGEAVEIFGAGPLDVSAESACGLYRSTETNTFLKLYP